MTETARPTYLQITAAAITAALLWFYMFSPWTAGLTNFWLTMTFSAVILTSITLAFTPDRRELFAIRKPVLQLLSGIVLAFFLWGMFFVGDRLSSLLFDFARPQVDSVYSMKEGFPPSLIAVLLLFIIGPAEELFWRGFIQRSLAKKVGVNLAFAITTTVYALVHVWSFNFMLVMAALVAGAVWGFVYRIKPGLLPSLVVSHALWDALVFIIIPI